MLLLVKRPSAIIEGCPTVADLILLIENRWLAGWLTISYHTISYSINNVADMRNVQQIHIELELK